jgi:hypothetical protein
LCALLARFCSRVINYKDEVTVHPHPYADFIHQGLSFSSFSNFLTAFSYLVQKENLFLFAGAAMVSD